MLTALRSFSQLSWPERRLTLQAWWLLLVVTAGLRLLGPRVVNRAMKRRVARGRAPRPGVTPQRLASLVAGAANRHLAAVGCLPRSLVLHRMLLRRGEPAELRLGVRREAGVVAAHAWVELRGLPVGELVALGRGFQALSPALPER